MGIDFCSISVFLTAYRFSQMATIRYRAKATIHRAGGFFSDRISTGFADRIVRIADRIGDLSEKKTIRYDFPIDFRSKSVKNPIGKNSTAR